MGEKREKERGGSERHAGDLVSLFTINPLYELQQQLLVPLYLVKVMKQQGELSSRTRHFQHCRQQQEAKVLLGPGPPLEVLGKKYVVIHTHVHTHTHRGMAAKSTCREVEILSFPSSD